MAARTAGGSAESWEGTGRALRELPPGPPLDIGGKSLRVRLVRALQRAVGAIVGFGVVVAVLHLVP